MDTQIADHEYLLDHETIVDRCFIPLEVDHADEIKEQYTQTCREYFKNKMLSCDYSDFPDYFKESCHHLYSAPQKGEDEGLFDLDSALEVLNQMLDEHIIGDCESGLTIIGCALRDSYSFFEELLEIAVTSSLFPVKQFTVESNDYGGSDDEWVTIYECHKGKIRSVYCSG